MPNVNNHYNHEPWVYSQVIATWCFMMVEEAVLSSFLHLADRDRRHPCVPCPVLRDHCYNTSRYVCRHS